MKNTILLTLILFVIFSACSKEEKKPETQQVQKKITYPAMHRDLKNVAVEDTFSIKAGEKYIIAADLPKGSNLKILFHRKPEGPDGNGGIFPMENDGFVFTFYNGDSTMLTAEGNDKIVSVPFMIAPPANVEFHIYENNSKTPTRSKDIVGK